MRIQNIQQVRINGKKVTLFDVYELQNNSYVFQYQESVDGHYKKESTLIKKAGL